MILSRLECNNKPLIKLSWVMAVITSMPLTPKTTPDAPASGTALNLNFAKPDQFHYRLRPAFYCQFLHHIRDMVSCAPAKSTLLKIKLSSWSIKSF